MPNRGKPAPPEALALTRTRWGPRSAWSAGALLFLLDTVQAVLLTPWLLGWIGASELSFWLALSSALGLVSVALAAFSPPLVRHIAQSQAVAGTTPAAPSNWLPLRRHALRFGGVVLALLVLAFVPLLADALRERPERWLAVLLYVAALALRLRASASFVLLNGCGQVGRDKWLLAAASGLTLVLLVLAAALLRSVTAMAAAALLGSLALWAMAWRAERLVARLPGPQAAAPPDPTEMRRLLLLGVAGFVQAGTTVPLATVWLPADEAVSFGFWFRAAAVTGVLAGYYAQVRFPAWARGDASTPRELAWVQVLIAGVAALVALAIAVSSQVPAMAGLSMLLPATIAALCVAAALTASSQLLGVYLLARGRSGFVAPAAAIALAAPLLACGLAAWLTPAAFVFGYLLCAIALRGLLQAHWLRLRNEAAARVQPAQSRP